jgi:hypothetical protein
MSSPEVQRAEFDADFWERLDGLEDRHRRLQSDHESARRGIERLTPSEIEEVWRAWHHYCEVIAELERTTTEFETLRKC